MRVRKLFRKNKTATGPKQEELAGKIAGCIVRFQTRIAIYLNDKTKHLSGKARLLLLIVFCVLFAAVNLYLLISSITY